MLILRRGVCAAAVLLLPGVALAFDTDGDGIDDRDDNCPLVVNGNQADQDLDGTGDQCDYHPTIPDYLLGKIDPRIDALAEALRQHILGGPGPILDIAVEEIFVGRYVDHLTPYGASDPDGDPVLPQLRVDGWKLADALDGSSGSYPITQDPPWGVPVEIYHDLVDEAADLISEVDVVDVDLIDEFLGADSDGETLETVIQDYRGHAYPLP